MNKKLCIKCKVDEYNEIGWDDISDRMWGVGRFWCPMKYQYEKDYGKRYVFDKPPSYCPYILEHLLDE